MRVKRHILVAGAGVSGIAAAKMALNTGSSVVLYDGNKEQDEEKLRAQFPKDADVSIVLGEQMCIRDSCYGGQGRNLRSERHADGAE